MTMKYAVPPPGVRVLGIQGRSEVFPVNRVYCVGRNYAAHIREQGKDPEREPPFFFMKPASAVVPVSTEGAVLEYPSMTGDYQHEIELVVAIGKGGRDIPAETALEHVYGYAIGLDMTRRDLQMVARDMGRAWESGKSFSPSAPIGPVYPATDTDPFTEGAISLEVNGEIRQAGNLNELIWPVPDIIADLSRHDPLEAGDLIMTGTPAGVRAVIPGDEMRGRIEGLGEIIVRVVERA